MDAPTAEEVQSWTKLAELKAASIEDAERIVAVANSLFKRITGQTFEGAPTEDEPVYRQVVKGLAESLWFDESEEQLETLSDFHLIQSFSAGPYQETRRSPEDMIKLRLLHPWGWLNRLLWLLLTEDMRDYWEDFFDTEGHAPASSVTEVDWSGGPFGMPGGPPYDGFVGLGE